MLSAHTLSRQRAGSGLARPFGQKNSLPGTAAGVFHRSWPAFLADWATQVGLSSPLLRAAPVRGNGRFNGDAMTGWERFNPYLLDKLAEPDPENGSTLEGGYGYDSPSGMTLEEYKQAVLRDLGRMLNTRTYWPEHPSSTGMETDNTVQIPREHVPIFADFP